MANINSEPTPAVNINRIERILAVMIVALVVLSLLCFVAIIVATSAGFGANDGFSQGVWPAVFMTPYAGLPVAFLLILALLVSNALRRRRAARGENR